MNKRILQKWEELEHVWNYAFEHNVVANKRTSIYIPVNGQLMHLSIPERRAIRNPRAFNLNY